MTEDDLDQIERQLEIALPDAYRELQLDYPHPGCNDLAEFGFFQSADRVLRANQECRRDGWFATPWPHHYFIVGDTGCGDAYFIVIGGDGRVFLADHEGGSDPVRDLGACLAAPDLSEHIEEQVEADRKVAAAFAARQARRQERRWWQFWK